VPPRWIRTKDYQPADWKPRHPEDDWLLISAWWAAYWRRRLGPAGAATPVAHGPAQTRGALLGTWRRWQQWLGCGCLTVLA
jgi:hypothetical protein